jgi:hypothetical protein
MATSFDELIREMNDHAKPVRIQLAFEVLPALDGTLHAVDPDPDKMVETYAVSLCNRALTTREAQIGEAQLCGICLEISHERQAEFDAEAAK